MKTLIVLVLAATSMAAGAQSHYRSAYVTKSGTYVPPSYATNPNNTKLDNYSTVGNVNPYTGRVGTVDPYRADTYRPSTIQPYRPSTYQPYRVPSLLDND